MYLKSITLLVLLAANTTFASTDFKKLCDDAAESIFSVSSTYANHPITSDFQKSTLKKDCITFSSKSSAYQQCALNLFSKINNVELASVGPACDKLVSQKAEIASCVDAAVNTTISSGKVNINDIIPYDTIRKCNFSNNNETTNATVQQQKEAEQKAAADQKAATTPAASPSSSASAGKSSSLTDVAQKIAPMIPGKDDEKTKATAKESGKKESAEEPAEKKENASASKPAEATSENAPDTATTSDPATNAAEKTPDQLVEDLYKDSQKEAMNSFNNFQPATSADILAGKNVMAAGGPEATGSIQSVGDLSLDDAKKPLDEKTQLTTEVEKANQELSAAVKSLQSAEKQITLLPISKNLISKLETSLTEYMSKTKDACLKSAEKASFFCAEGTSTGVKAVNFMMNKGAPILAVINSAQKSCSSLSTLTKLAGTGLTIAKGVCMATKYMCDGSCAKSAADLTKVNTELKNLQAQVKAEVTKLSMPCSSPAPPPYCAAQLKIENMAVQAAIQSVDPLIKKEGTASPGTTPKLVAGCQTHMQDIALMALNIAGVFKANSNAKACDKQLSTSTASTAAVSKTQYCDVPANASTDLCRCQKDSTATGCPNSLITGGTAATDNVAGVNLKSASSGASGFATAATGTTPTSGLNKANGLSTSSTDPLATGVGSGTTAASGAGSGASGSSETAGASASGSSASDSAKVKAESKKWDFGAFSESSSGGSGSSSAGKNSSGAALGIGQKEMDAINRKVASEQMAAEVTPSSGKSNWEKVRQSYLSKENSFISGK